jgi:hypothetical protein
MYKRRKSTSTRVIYHLINPHVVWLTAICGDFVPEHKSDDWKMINCKRCKTSLLYEKLSGIQNDFWVSSNGLYKIQYMISPEAFLKAREYSEKLAMGIGPFIEGVILNFEMTEQEIKNDPPIDSC